MEVCPPGDARLARDATLASMDMERSDSVENLSYDLLTTLQSKLEGVSAYDKYIRDCQQAGDQECGNLFQQLKQQDTQQVEQLRSTIENLVKQGKFH